MPSERPKKLPAPQDGRIKFSDWPRVYKQLKEDVRRSERLTAKDMAVTINCREYDR